MEASAESLMREKYDIIIADYWQARMSGFFRLAREFQPDAEKIIVYDNDINKDIPENYTVVRKPFSDEAIGELVKISGRC